MTKYWRIRMKADGDEYSQKAWDRDEVGIWYGAWSAGDFKDSYKKRDLDATVKSLNKLKVQKSLAKCSHYWREHKIETQTIHTAKRFFEEMADDDWVVIFLENEKAIGLAQIKGPVQSNYKHVLNTKCGEVFKYRQIFNKKKFLLSDLPDDYLLVSSQGRSNIHKLNAMKDHIAILANCKNVSDVKKEICQKPFDKILDLMGPANWEAFCTAWLIIEHNFIPTGLLIGGTLKGVDVVGRNRTSHRRIVGQCKKDRGKITIDFEFKKYLNSDTEAFYFSYGGLKVEPPKGIKNFGKNEALKWLDTERGKEYINLYRA